MIIVISNLQGVWGFISGGLTWFAIPFSLATTMGLAYLGLSSAQGAPLLSDEDVAKGKLKIKAIRKKSYQFCLFQQVWPLLSSLKSCLAPPASTPCCFSS